MAIDIKTQPNEFSFGYNVIPLRVGTDQEINQLKYLVTINYNESQYVNSQAIDYAGYQYTLIEVDSHTFKQGETILFYNELGAYSYTNYYTVVEVLDSQYFIIDLIIDRPIDPGFSAYFYSVVSYKVNPDEENEVKLNLANVLKDFVSIHFEDSNEIYNADGTRFDYNVTIGTEDIYSYDFVDNKFESGNLAFINPFYSNQDFLDSPFRIGDQITIFQDKFEWVYDDNTFVSGNLAFTSATIDHAFEVGDQVTISGQVTQPNYNGATTVIDVPDSKTIVVNKAFTTSTPVEGGSCFGVPAPEYNTTTNIKDLYYDVTDGFVVVTNIPFTTSTPAITGYIRYADSRFHKDLAQTRVQNLKVYNSKQSKIEYAYSGNNFSEFVMQNRANNLNNFSSIFKGKNQRIRIEQSTKSWLLVRSDNLGGLYFEPTYRFYDSNDVLISEYIIPNSDSLLDFYTPVGIDQIISNTSKVLQSGSSLSSVKDNVSYYEVLVRRNSLDASNAITYYINKLCSKFDLFHLCFQDSLGSWASIPFKFVSKDITEFERKEYYKKEGKFNLSDDTFGYDTFSKGESIYFNRSRDTIKLNSGWMKENENFIIKDLFDSPNVMVQLPTGELISVTITNKKQELFKEISDRLWQYQIEVKKSMNN